MKHLPTVTLICIDCFNYAGAVDAIQKSLQQIKPQRAVFLTDIDIDVEGVDVIQIPTISTKEEYSQFLIKELRNYFHTLHCLVIQWDGYVLNGDSWDDEFLKYDYIGAPWLYPDRNVGNGGFSLRTHRLQSLLAGDNFIQSCHPEDEVIGRLYRDYLESKYQIAFAPESIASKFSFELKEPTQQTFGFHGFFHKPYKPVVIIKRTGAMGDVVMVEPLIDYFFENGYNVYLDTLPEIMQIFFNYKHELRYVSKLNKNIRPERQINLDMSYETFPRENVLKTYFKFAGVNIERGNKFFRNSKLNVNKNAAKWMFNKYVVVHIDDTGMPYRNVYGINWDIIEGYLYMQGYTVIQVGKRTDKKVGIYMYTETKHMLMYLLAGADAVIGIDSGITQLAVSLSIPTIIFTGSVNLELRYQKFDNIEVIKTMCPEIENEYCYHSKDKSVVGVDCVINKETPPCTQFQDFQLINAINKIKNGNI